MSRIPVLVAAIAGLVAVACGAAPTAASGASSSPSAGRGGGAQFRNGATGQLVQVNGQSLILTGPTGDLTVTYANTTTFTRTSTAVLADVVPGVCILATGQKDSTGPLTATTVRLSPKASSGCVAIGQFGPNGAPRAGASPRPTPSGQSAFAFVTGEVTSAAGISITVLTSASGSQTITVPTTAAVTMTVVASSTDLRTGECLRATGARDSAGTVEATSITITPAGPSGTCVTGFGGRGFGRGGATPGASPPNG
ncbi:MAG: hypothetical protein ACYDB4_16360 [Candidatus Dormibacteraceae bacterium]